MIKRNAPLLTGRVKRDYNLLHCPSSFRRCQVVGEIRDGAS